MRTRSAPFIFSTLVGLFSGLVATSIQAFDFSTHGYLRNRVTFYHDLDTQTTNNSANQGGLGDNDRLGSIFFAQERLRLEPVMKLNDNISIHTSMDVLDNIIQGTQETKKIDFLSPIVGTIQLPGAGGAIGVTGGQAGENKALNLRRVYMDILTTGGKFRIGRQPSHIGLGVFQNDGNGIFDDFGDTADRILYLAALETPKLGTINAGFAVDFTFTKQKDPRIDGLGGAITGPKEDLHQFGGIFLYDIGDFSVGTFSGIRYRNGKEGATTTTARRVLVDGNGTAILDSKGNNQLGDPIPAGKDGNTLLYFTDLYGEYKNGPFKFRGEYIFLTGKLSTGVAIDAIPFNGIDNPSALAPIELSEQNTAMIHIGALEADANYDFGEIHLKGGYASGDAQPLSSKITQFGFRPDYQLGLLLFHTPLGSSPRIMQENQNGIGNRQLVGAVPVTGNYINNAVYAAIGYDHHLNLDNILPKPKDSKIGLKLITAWAPKNNFDIDFAEITGINTLPRFVNSGKWYGWEVDSTFQTRLWDHFLFDVTGGVLFPGPAYDVAADITYGPSNVAGIPNVVYDKANISWGARTTFLAEF